VIVTLGGEDVVHGGEGNDLICLGPSATEYRSPERAFGDRGRDRISGGPGDETLYGGKGADALHLDAGGGRAIGGPAGDEMVGGSGRDFFGGEGGPGSGGSASGGGYNYEFTPGEPGDDVFVGHGGNDRFYIGTGDKTVVGGKGIERLVYWSHERGDFRADLERGRASGPGRSRLRGIEDVHAWAPGEVVLRGDEGANELLGSPSLSTSEAQLYGGGGDDLLVGQDDWTRRHEGDADMYGGLGNDVIVGQHSTNDERLDELFGGPGADRIEPGVGLRQVSGGPGGDELGPTDVPSDASLSYDGGPGFDTVGWPYSTGVEADLETGEAVVQFGTAGTWTYPIVGIEAVYGSESGPDVLLGDDGINALFGGTIGQPFDGATPDGDQIEGRGGDDELYGDDGNDELDGGEGADVIDGGEGLDTCRNGESLTSCEAG
jgi:Ca2+-binding RTX toxin-like protein